MYLIKEITDDPKQKHTVILPAGDSAVFTMEYKPQQIGWFMNLTYKSFTVNGIRITTSPNFLHQYKNLIPFGMACFVDENQEPLLQTDFVSTRAQLYVLDSSETLAFENILKGV